jgi:hypothetical protein
MTGSMMPKRRRGYVGREDIAIVIELVSEYDSKRRYHSMEAVVAIVAWVARRTSSLCMTMPTFKFSSFSGHHLPSRIGNHMQ